MFYGLGMTATATAGAFNDPKEGGWSFWSFLWPFGKKNPNKGGGPAAQAEAPNIGRFLGVTISCLGCAALVASGFAIAAAVSLLPSLWLGHSLGAAYDQSAFQSALIESNKQPQREAEEPSTEATGDQAETLTPNELFALLEEQNIFLSNEQKKELQEQFSNGASMQAWLKAAEPFFSQQQNSSASSPGSSGYEGKNETEPTTPVTSGNLTKATEAATPATIVNEEGNTTEKTELPNSSHQLVEIPNNLLSMTAVAENN